jgi:GNAT superfamily N-acetyltransferase
MLIRDATGDDWPAVWPILRAIVAAGETLTVDRDISEERMRAGWLKPPPGRTVVAVDAGGTVLGTATLQPNQGGPGSHVANAGFMVDPARSGQGVGRALGEHVLALARAGGYRAIVFNAVVETNTRAVALWQSLGLRILATIPAAFEHPAHGYVGLHIMHRTL